MKIIYEEVTTENPIFADCENNQFFVFHNRLYQKVTGTRANQITNEKGEPYSDQIFFAAAPLLTVSFQK